MFVNNLMNTYKLCRSEVENVLNLLGLQLNVRGENLTATEYVMLTEQLKKLGVKL